jgi:dethiobiotin synthetase
MRPRPFFVVGTDTDVGKTFISSALLGLARGRGLRCIGMKPIAAGCRLDAGSLRSDDALSLMSASDTQVEYETINPIAFKPHIAPHIAAAQAGRALRAADLTAHCRAVLARAVDFVLIEGAGGWLVPINDTETLADVCVELNAAVILVVGMKLGCLNHALLTAAAIERVGLELAGWVANSVTGPMSCLDENVDTLRERLRAPCLGVVPRLGAVDPSAAQPFLNLDPLLS